MSLRKLLAKGRMVSTRNSIRNLLEKRYGSAKPLLSPSGIPACVLCATYNDEKRCIEPFVLRTYEYPSVKDGFSAEENGTDQFQNNPAVGNVDTAAGDENGNPSFALVRSATCSSVSIIDAMAATSAVPVVFDRVKINIGGKEKAFADGALFCNSPVAIAIDEARRPIACSYY